MRLELNSKGHSVAKQVENYDDWTIKPVLSDNPLLNSRSTVNIYRKFSFSDIPLFPLINANMDGIANPKMIEFLDSVNCMSSISKFEKDIAWIINFLPQSKGCFLTTGIREEDFNKVMYLSEHIEIKRLIVDAPNGYIPKFYEYLKKYRKALPNAFIIAGNIGCLQAANKIKDYGINGAKIGIGPGGQCTTSNVTGVSVHPAKFLYDNRWVFTDSGFLIIADGGVRNTAHFCKAIDLGADIVMIGSYLAGSDLHNGTWENHFTRVEYKGFPEVSFDKVKFYGMSSKEAMQEHYDETESYRASEGKVSWINYKGQTKDLVEDLKKAMRSMFCYTNRSY